MNANTCLNCGNQYAGNFCPQCGQKSHTHRYTLATIIHDIPHSVFHVDRGVLYTFKELCLRPGQAVREYITGKRITHFSPFAYLILLCAIRTFIDYQILHIIHRTSVMNPGVLNADIALFFDKYPALMLCILTPFLSFWSWLFNLDSGYNYWENFILNIYLMAQFNIFFIISRTVTHIAHTGHHDLTPMLVAFMLYLSYAYYHFFPRRRKAVFIISRFLLFFAVTLTLLTGLSFTGFMTRWWWW